MDGNDPARTSVVVFVHGVLSDAVGAWSYDSVTSWPCMLRKEPAFGGSNIYLYAYDTAALGANPSIDKVARQLVMDLLADKVLNHAHVSMVVHSMGGLVLSRALLSMQRDQSLRNAVDRIRLVQFYGTPGDGAAIAKAASYWSDNPQFSEMQPGDNAAVLEAWRAIKWPFSWYCYAEGKSTGWFWPFSTLVVPQESASAFCSGRPQAFEVLERFDHLSMVKPESLQAQPHRALFRNFVGCVADRIVTSDVPSLAGTREGQEFLRLISDLRDQLADRSSAGRVAHQPAVEAKLYRTGWGQQYLLPKDLRDSQLLDAAYDRLGAGVFANEFVKIFGPRAEFIRPVWIGSVSVLERRIKDGRIVELRSRWRDAGIVTDGDYAIEVDLPDLGRIVLIGGMLPVSGAMPQARLKGLLVLPSSPRSCI